MMDEPIYEESLSSNRTGALFITLTLLFLFLLTWRMRIYGFDLLSVAFLFFFLFFLFYSLNYRTLQIRLTEAVLKLKFGVFTWTIPVDNIGDCRHDELPILMRYGGAGIHFMSVHKRYRASFNFLEHPRVVIALIRKVGLVREISFSTRHPDQVIHLLQNLRPSPSAT